MERAVLCDQTDLSSCLRKHPSPSCPSLSLSVFFPLSLAKRLSIFKEPTLSFGILFYYLVFFHLSALIFISFLLLTLGQFLFSVPGGIRLGCLRVFFFLMQAFITINFPLVTAFAASHKFLNVEFSFSFVSRYLFLFDFFFNPLDVQEGFYIQCIFEFSRFSHVIDFQFQRIVVSKYV